MRPEEEEEALGFNGDKTKDGNDLGIEASFGENNFDFKARDRYIYILTLFSTSILGLHVSAFFFLVSFY